MYTNDYAVLLIVSKLKLICKIWRRPFIQTIRNILRISKLIVYFCFSQAHIYKWLVKLKVTSCSKMLLMWTNFSLQVPVLSTVGCTIHSVCLLVWHGCPQVGLTKPNASTTTCFKSDIHKLLSLFFRWFCECEWLNFWLAHWSKITQTTKSTFLSSNTGRPMC